MNQQVPLVSKLSHNKINYYQALIISLGFFGFNLVSFIPEFLTVSPKVVTYGFRAFYLCLCIVVIITEKKKYTLTKSFLPILFFILLYVSRSIFDSFFEFSKLKEFLPEFWMFIVFLCIVPMIAFSSPISQASLDTAKLFTFRFAVIANLLGLVNTIIHLSGEFKGGRFSGNEIMNPVTFGQMGVMLIAISLTYFQKSSFFKKLILLCLIVLGLSIVSLSGSRGPILELIVIAILYLIFNFKHINKIVLFCLTVIFVLALNFYGQEIIFFDTAISRLQNAGNTGSDAEERYFLFNDAINSIIQYPIFGYQAIGMYPHNLLLEALLALGIIGGGIMLYIYFLSIKSAVVLLKQNRTMWVGLLFTMHLCATLIAGSIYNSIEFWSFLVLVYILARNIRKTQLAANE